MIQGWRGRLLSAAYFLAHSEDTAIADDHAIFELDAIAADLQAMDASASGAFVQLLAELAASERDPKLAAFMRAFAADNGLIR